ncbi:DUF551 domain-containing protein [Escherichia marmotae]|nr:DUF551 domain-containing protein [Escherichia marmotae]
MTTITRENAEIKSFITGFLSDSAHDNQSSDSLLANVFRIALASLEAKPIGAFHIAEQQVDGTSDYLKDGEWPIDNGIIEVYAAPPVPVIQADVAQAIENLKQKLVECNRYNYCADAVKNVEYASRVLALQNQNMSAPITPEAIENAIEYIRSIAFHINEDDYHGKHIAYFMRQALAWLEGHSCSDDRQGKAENQPVRGNQAAESNRGNEWTGNPDIDNAIIMLDRIDTAESYDDDRIEDVKTVLRRLAGNSPVTPDSWISCSERMPEIRQTVIGWNGYAVRQCVYTRNEYAKTQKGREPRFETSTGIWHGVTHWMLLPEPPQEVNRG